MSTFLERTENAGTNSLLRTNARAFNIREQTHELG